MSAPVELMLFVATVLGVSAYVTLPIIRASLTPRGWVATSVGNAPRELLALTARRDAALHALRDLQADHDAGTLSDEDFDRMRADAMRDASRLMDEIDKFGEGQS